jgi:predicted PurR-regulated permease PerM
LLAVEDKIFAVLLVAITVAFGWILGPFLGPLIWASVLAILFAGLFRRISKWLGAKRSTAAAVTVFFILVIVVIPLTLITSLLLEQLIALVKGIQSGQIDVKQDVQNVLGVLPSSLVDFLNRHGLLNLDQLRDGISAWLKTRSQDIAAGAFGIGRSTLGLLLSTAIAVYLLFYLLRDGDMLVERIEHAIPLRPNQRQAIVSSFTVVIRSIVKCSLLVALLQGALGGLIFYLLGINGALLWGVVMALLSLLPSVGAALIWAPAGVYLLLSGPLWKGIVLLAFGCLVIGPVDTLLRSRLMGKNTRMPDYVVFLSVLGGLSVFGLNGVIIGPVIGALFIAAWALYD